MTATVIEPGTIEPPAGDIPHLRLPERSLFETRAARLTALATGHTLSDYLHFLAAVAHAQHSALDLTRNMPLPDAVQLARCCEHGLPPLGAQGWTRAPVWRAVLRHILAALEAQPMPDAARAAITQLRDADDAELERLANELLDGDYRRLDRASAPFVAAALQVYWLHMATSLGVHAFGQLSTPGLCPVCGSEPVASVVHIGRAAEHGLRYLSCALCGSEWHVVRIKCAFCETTKGISYYAIEGGGDAIKAERCDACESYLKILYMEKDPHVDVVADDIASVTLDVLMAEAGVSRGGVNYFLLGGNA